MEPRSIAKRDRRAAEDPKSAGGYRAVSLSAGEKGRVGAIDGLGIVELGERARFFLESRRWEGESDATIA